jgi:hypothetical protein
VGDSLLAEDWSCIPELTAPPAESALSVRENDKKVNSNKHKQSKPKPKPTNELASQQETKPPKHSHPFANFAAESLLVIAGNPRTPSSTLCWLATHFNPNVRAVVSGNKNALPETIWLLARDYDESVRLAVAEHEQDDEKVLKALCHDESPLVAWHAKQTLAVLLKKMAEETVKPGDNTIAGHQTIDVLAAMQDQLPKKFKDSVDEIEFLKLIASKTTTPPHRLATLARHPNHEIRALVAENTNSPRDVFWLLAKDSVVEVKIKLTDNYNCPVEVIEYLQDDSDSYVAWQSKNIMAKLLGDATPDMFEDDSSAASQRLLHTI